MKKALLIIGAVLLVLLVGAGSFWAGMTYQTDRVAQVRANFESARGAINPGQFPGNEPGLSGSGVPAGQIQQSRGGGGTAGEIKTIDGNTMTVSTAQDVATVNLSADTQIEKTVQGTAADLQPGTRVMVIGQEDDSGNITASSISILSGDAFIGGTPGSAPTGTEP